MGDVEMSVPDSKSVFQSKTMWGIFVAWLGVKLQAALTPYGVPIETVRALTDLLTEGGLLFAVIGRSVATKKLGV